jgi:perosamine synthetase
MKNEKMKIPFCKQIFDRDMERAAIHALRNERFSLGESVYKFEEEFAKYCGADYAISVNSGTAALHLSLLSLGINRGDQIITTPTSFIATSNAIIHARAKPIFSDIDENTYNIDPKLISNKINELTKGIVPVDLYGNPCDMDLLIDVAKERDLFILEDACQAHGAVYKGKRLGGLADIDITCFSFYPTKNMTVGGDGGMVTTNDESVAESIKKLRNCGRAEWNIHDVIGYTARLNTVNAAIGRVQLKKLDEWNDKRRKNADIYRKFLSDIEEIVLPPGDENGKKPVYHLFTIKTERRDELKLWLEKNGIQCGIYYPSPIHLQPIYRQMYGYKEGDFPISERHAKQAMSLPIFPDLKEEEIKYVSEKIRKFFDR